MKKFYLNLLIVCLALGARGQGKLLLVGGGGESPGGWSDAPYGWAVEQSGNKRVAIVSTDAGNDPQWLVDYFVSLGAIQAKNLEISSKVEAEVASVYDSLMNYDFIFFKGGDQWLYYSYYRGTSVEQAVIDKFNQGGVIGGTSAGMAILGEYVYTAEKSSLLPSEGLQNANDPNITIENDFMPLLDGFITDTHYLERGRLPRLQSFMANLYLNQQELVNGIASDDQTAITIDENKLATVHGTGGGYFYQGTNYSETQQRWSGLSKAIHLADGMKINLNDFSVVKGPSNSNTAKVEENGNYEVFLCASEWIDVNSECVKEMSQLDDTLLIVTGESRITAANLLQALADNGKSDVKILSAIPENNVEDQWQLRNTIKRSKNIVFINNDAEELKAYFTDGPNGALLKNHLTRNENFVGFFGNDAQLAGAKYVTNHFEDNLNAYNGTLEYADGLELLSSSIILNDAYVPETLDFYENNTLSGLYALSAYQLTYSFFLSGKSFARMYQFQGENSMDCQGNYSTVVAINRSVNHEPFSVKAGSGPRNNASFDNLTISTLNLGSSLLMGTVIESEDEPYQFEEAPPKPVTSLEKNNIEIKIYPSSSNGTYRYQSKVPALLKVYNIKGVVVSEVNMLSGNGFFDIEEKGIFILKIWDKQNSVLLKSQKLVHP